MQFGHLDNAYNASHEPIRGFNKHRISGVEKFNRDEHFLYLRQYDNTRSGAFASPHLGVPGANLNCDAKDKEYIAKLHRQRSVIQPASRDHIKRRIRRLSIAAATGVTTVFVIASSIGIYW